MRLSLRRGAPAAQETSAHRRASLTRFDFLDGAFRADEKARLKGLVALGTSGIMLISVVLSGFTLASQNTTAGAELAEANRRVSSLSVELGQLSNTGGLGEQELAARLQVLRSHLDEAGGEQVQVLLVVNGLQSVMPPGAQITSVELRRTDTGVQRLTVQVALETFTRLTALSEGVSSLWYLSDTAISWNSSGERVAVTVRADIDPALLEGPVPRLQERVAEALSGVAPEALPGQATQDAGGEG